MWTRSSADCWKPSLNLSADGHTLFAPQSLANRGYNSPKKVRRVGRRFLGTMHHLVGWCLQRSLPVWRWLGWSLALPTFAKDWGL